MQLQLDPSSGQVAWVVVKDLMKARTYTIKANKYILCAGAVLTVEILVNSGFNSHNLPALVSTTGFKYSHRCLRFPLTS